MLVWLVFLVPLISQAMELESCSDFSFEPYRTELVTELENKIKIFKACLGAHELIATGIKDMTVAAFIHGLPIDDGLRAVFSDLYNDIYLKFNQTEYLQLDSLFEIDAQHKKLSARDLFESMCTNKEVIDSYKIYKKQSNCENVKNKLEIAYVKEFQKLGISFPQSKYIQDQAKDLLFLNKSLSNQYSLKQYKKMAFAAILINLHINSLCLTLDQITGKFSEFYTGVLLAKGGLNGQLKSRKECPIL